MQGGQVVDLGPHPADPLAQDFHSVGDATPLDGPTILEQKVFGTEIYVYSGRGGYACALRVLMLDLTEKPHAGALLAPVSTYTFWRFFIQIPLADSEMKIKYSINDGLEMVFFVPGRRQTMRLAAYSVRWISLFYGALDLVTPCSAMGSALVSTRMISVDRGFRVATILSGSIS